eukprot:gene27127-2356_t
MWDASAPILDPDAMAASDFLHAIWIAIAFVAARLVSEYLLSPPLTKFLRWIKPGSERHAGKIYDEFFMALAGIYTEALAIHVLIEANYGCRPWSTDPCLEMMVHHALTLTLICLGYGTNLLRYGTMWMALFDSSNPFLHGAKILNTIKADSLKTATWVVYLIFTLVFLVARILASPYSILRPAFTQSFDILPLWVSLAFITLMVLLYILQCFWFYKIVLIGIRGGKSKKEANEE